MADDLSPLLQMLSGQADPETLARVLRGQRSMGLVGQLSGDRVLSPVGQTLFSDAQRQQLAAQQDQQKRAELQGEALRAALAARRQQENADRAYTLDQERLAVDRQRLGLERDRLNRPDKPDKPASPDNLREEFQKLQPFKDFNQISAAYKKIQTTSETGAGDMSLIFGYMKLLDPNSTVREGEYATAQNAGSVPQNLIAAYNKAISGEKLAPDVRKQFRDESTKVYNAQKSEYDRFAAYYVRLAKQRGLNPADVVLGYEEPTTPDAGAPAAVRKFKRNPDGSLTEVKP